MPEGVGLMGFAWGWAFSAVLCILSAVQQPFCAPPARSKPNILVIMVDDLGYGDLSVTGAPDMRTPKVDSLFDSGIRFDRFHSNSTVCSPTRASLLTGRYPDLSGVPGVVRTDAAENFGFLNTGLTTLPQSLKTAGYHTALVGKWHLGLESPNRPRDRGFDHFHGFLGDMMDDYYTHLREGRNFMRENESVITPTGHATDLFTQWALDYIQDRRGKPDPFFLFLAYNAPHHPVQPPQAWLDKVKSREGGISETRAKLVALIEHLDDGIGRVLAGLRSAGFGENTLVVFTSDNGGLLEDGARNLPWSGGKGQMLEGGITVPTGFSWKGVIPAGKVSRRMALTMDLFPTFCEASGAECNHEMDGRSFLPTLLGQAQPEEDRTLFFVRRGDKDAADLPYYAALKGQAKILQNTPSEAFRLYDLALDPGERTNLGQDNDAYRNLYGELQAHIGRAEKVGWKPGSPPVVARTLKVLSPDGGETWFRGSRQVLRWRSTGDIPTVRLEWFSGSGPWRTLAASAPNPDSIGTFAWQLPDSLSGNLKLRISALGGNVSDTGNARVQIPLSIRKYPSEKAAVKRGPNPGATIWRWRRALLGRVGE